MIEFQFVYSRANQVYRPIKKTCIHGEKTRQTIKSLYILKRWIDARMIRGIIIYSPTWPPRKLVMQDAEETLTHVTLYRKLSSAKD